MARPEPRNLTVMKSVRITPNLHRLTLGGEGLADFPRSQSGGYIKLMLPGAEGRKTPVRTYTIRSQSERAIEVDFALHGSIEKSGHQMGAKCKNGRYGKGWWSGRCQTFTRYARPVSACR